MEKLPYWEVDRGMGQLMDRPEIAYVLASEFQFSLTIDCWGHKRWAAQSSYNSGLSAAERRKTFGCLELLA